MIHFIYTKIDNYVDQQKLIKKLETQGFRTFDTYNANEEILSICISRESDYEHNLIYCHSSSALDKDDYFMDYDKFFKETLLEDIEIIKHSSSFGLL